MEKTPDRNLPGYDDFLGRFGLAGLEGDSLGLGPGHEGTVSFKHPPVDPLFAPLFGGGSPFSSFDREPLDGNEEPEMIL